MKDMQKTYNRCGFAVFGVAATVAVASLALGIVIKLMGDAANGFYAIYQKYILLFNEAVIALSILIGALILFGAKAEGPEKTKIPAKTFITILCVCFPIGAVGNIIGSTWLAVWNALTGNQVTNQLTELMLDLPIWQVALCTGLLAPILEELFFRKLLIDRLYRHGELAAILTSAVFFGLIHQNFSQFFYAFGVGVVFGYIYCKTRSYLAVTVAHVIFNMVMGVIPSIFLPKVLGLVEIITEMTEEALMEALPSIVGEYGIALVCYLFHLLIMGALNIAGIVILLVNLKKIKVEQNAPEIPAAEKRKAVLLNPGCICAAILLIALMVASLFIS